MLLVPEGIDIDPSMLGSLDKDRLLLQAQHVDLVWTTTLPSGHRAFVIWTDCDGQTRVDRYYVYVFRDTRFDWAIGKIDANEFVRPILEQSDWVYVVDIQHDSNHILFCRKVQWADLDHTSTPTSDARLYSTEGDDATPSST